jgi:uncharacterized protein with ParB-like and HNH nuclease domain
MQTSKAWLVQDVVEKNKRVFKIPVYQRNYDWKSTQCERLYEDIIKSLRRDSKHFTGTIVYIKGERDSSTLEESLIIDGQQRITTIFIMLKVIYDLAKENNDSVLSEVQDYLFNRNCEEEFKLKLKPVKEDDLAFKNLMNGNIENIDPSSNILRNYNNLRKVIQKDINENKTLRDILRGMKNLEVVEIILDKTQGDDPQTIFESINSTGLPLSLADKIRNFILMDDENQNYLYENYWLYFESIISNELLANYFTQYLNFKLTESINIDNAYEKFKRFYEQENFTHESMLIDLKRYCKYYAAFVGKKESYSLKITKYLRDFRLLDQSTLYPFLFSVFDDFNNNTISEEILIKILKLLRSYSLRRIVCEVPSNSLRGFFKTLYTRIFKETNNYDLYYEKIYTFFVSIKTKDKMIDDEDFKFNLKYKQLYPKKYACKYILASIENEGSNEQLDTSNMTIEHILPQKEGDPIWKNEIGNEQYKEVYDKYLHTLGNLTITGHNSELGTKSFDDKKAIIIENSKANKLNRSILSEEKWNENSILKRADILSDYVLNLFDYEKTEIIEERIPEEIILTLDNIEEATSTKPMSYILSGERVEVSSYSDMLTKVIKTLYEIDSQIIENKAEEKMKGTSSDRIYLSMEKTDLRKEKEILNTGIFFETNLSAQYILYFIKSLLELYNIDLEDFSYIIE